MRKLLQNCRIHLISIGRTSVPLLLAFGAIAIEMCRRKNLNLFTNLKRFRVAVAKCAKGVVARLLLAPG